MSDSYGQRRGYVSGAQVESFLNDVDQLRGNPSAFRSTRDYSGQNADATPQARRDLILNQDTLRPQPGATQDAQDLAHGDIAHIPFSVGVTASDQPILTRPANTRAFLLIQNTHAANILFVGFGIKPNSSNGIPIAAGGSLLMDAFVGQNDIWLAGSGANTTGILSYSNAGTGRG